MCLIEVSYSYLIIISIFYWLIGFTLDLLNIIDEMEELMNISIEMRH